MSKKTNKISMGFSIDPKDKTRLKSIAKRSGGLYSMSWIINMCIFSAIDALEAKIDKHAK